MGIIATPLGWIMRGLYYLVKNYGIALLLFTFVTRLIIFPMSVKQQKSTAKMGMLAPELEKLKKKYGKNQQKLQEEQMALYAKSGINPMASCLPMIVTMVILFALIPIIYGPLTYISDADKDELTNSNNLISGLYVVSSDIHGNDTTIEKLLEEFKSEGATEDEAYDKLKEYITDSKKCKNAAKSLDGEEKICNNIISAIKKHNNIDEFMLNEDYISKNLATSRPELMTFSFVNNADGRYADVLPETVRKAAEDIDYKSFGLDMGVIPSFKDMTWIIPFVSFILQIAVTIISQFFQRRNNPQAAKAMGMGMKIMFIIMPVFSLWIGFSYPAGLGLYWCYSSLFALIQTVVLNIAYSPAKMKAIIEAENEKNKKDGKKTMFSKLAEQQLEREGKAISTSDDDDDDQGERKKSKAEIQAENRRKIAEARRRMAEKYGDEYEEFLDEEEEEEQKPKPSGSKKKKNKNRNNNSNKNNGSQTKESKGEAAQASEDADAQDIDNADEGENSDKQE